MKRILITGANSYIGTSVEKHLAQWPEEYQVDTIDMHGDAWREKSFSGYDSVFHVAGIAHINTKKLDKAARDNYWKVNAELPVEVAMKAKAEGVRQFIFLSSMSVYGEHGGIREPVIITRETQPNPRDVYGQSKVAAEKGLVTLQQDCFSVAVLRPPMIYGEGCNGNYQLLVKAARKLPVFPNIENQRSMLHIDNLCNHVKLLLDEISSGLFLPQDSSYVSTSQLVKKIASEHGSCIFLTRLFNPVIRVISKKSLMIKKVFGSLVYELPTHLGQKHDNGCSEN